MRLRYIWPWLKAEFRWHVLGKKYEIFLTEEAQRRLDELTISYGNLTFREIEASA